MKHSNDGQDFICPGAEGDVSTTPLVSINSHILKTVGTAYGWRVVCRKHRRVWSWVRDDNEIKEDVYAEGGMIHADS